MNKKYDADPIWGVTITAEDDEAAEELDEAWAIRETELLWEDDDIEPYGILTSEANMHRLIDHILNPEHGGYIKFILANGAVVEFDIDPR